MSGQPNELAAFDRVQIILGGESWTVALADTPLLWSRGLMGVTSLSVDGMLFVFEDTASLSFWMKDTLLPLDIAFFSADGTLVDSFGMTPCEQESCRTYSAAGPFRYAIETVVGGFGGLDPLTLEVSGL